MHILASWFPCRQWRYKELTCLAWRWSWRGCWARPWGGPRCSSSPGSSWWSSTCDCDLKSKIKWKALNREQSCQPNRTISICRVTGPTLPESLETHRSTVLNYTKVVDRRILKLYNRETVGRVKPFSARSEVPIIGGAPKFVKYKKYPTNPFTIFEPQDQEINEFYVDQKRHSRDFEASKL